jgi:hypothetical protein
MGGWGIVGGGRGGPTWRSAYPTKGLKCPHISRSVCGKCGERFRVAVGFYFRLTEASIPHECSRDVDHSRLPPSTVPNAFATARSPHVAHMTAWLGIRLTMLSTELMGRSLSKACRGPSFAPSGAEERKIGEIATNLGTENEVAN